MPAPLSPVSEPVQENFAGGLQLDQSRDESRPIWLYAGGGLALVLLVFWLAWPRHSGPPAAQQVAATQPSPQTSIPQQSAPVPANPKIAGFSDAKTSSEATAPISGDQIWRVVVYDYHRREDAQAMASSINQRHPGLDAKVFSPRGRSVSYLVTVGSPMTRGEAARYRSRAIDSGMPRDTYIQNYRSE
jgi:cell division protein FtsN